jgi:hypothetical protein
MMTAARKLQSIGLLMLVTICALLAYPVSLHVASTRTELRRVEQNISETQRRIRMVEGEIAVLANLSQLERWNADNFGYVAPVSGQYLPDERALAGVRQLRGPVSAEARAPIALALDQPQSDDADTNPADGNRAAVTRAADDRVAVSMVRDIATMMPTATATSDRARPDAQGAPVR